MMSIRSNPKSRKNPELAQVESSPEWDALHAFDAENNTEPTITTAQRIAEKHGIAHGHQLYWSLVDGINSALQEAAEMAVRRAPLEKAALKSNNRGSLSER